MGIDRKYFTLVFKGDIGKFKLNPMNTETVFGKPVAAGRGDVFAEADELREQLDAALQSAGSQSQFKVRRGCIKEAFSGEPCLAECQDRRDCSANPVPSPNTPTEETPKETAASTSNIPQK